MQRSFAIALTFSTAINASATHAATINPFDFYASGTPNICSPMDSSILYIGPDANGNAQSFYCATQDLYSIPKGDACKYFTTIATEHQPPEGYRPRQDSQKLIDHEKRRAKIAIADFCVYA